MISTVICTLALALILVGIWHEEKLIVFEDKMWAKIKRIAKMAIIKIKLIQTRVKLLAIDIRICFIESVIKFLEA